MKSFLEEVDPEVVKYVEIGIPDCNPLYDGPTIKSTHSKALKNFRADHLMDFTSILKDKGIRSYALTYYDQIANGGTDFISSLKESGFSGAIIPDLLIDYSEASYGLIPQIEKIFSFIPFFNPATPDGVIQSVSSMTGSWIYYGLQPSTGIDIPFDLNEVASRIFSLIHGREINFGFGIRTIDQVREILGLGSNGIAIGSLLVQLLKDNDLEGFKSFQNSVKEAYLNAE